MTGSKKHGRFIFSASLVASVVLPAPIKPDIEMNMSSVLCFWSIVKRFSLLGRGEGGLVFSMVALLDGEPLGG